MRLLFLLALVLNLSPSFAQTYPGTLISIQGGSYTMGNNGAPAMFTDQDPEHTVAISDFLMAETEVTNTHFVDFLNQVALLNQLYVEVGIPGDWDSDSTAIANGISWHILADSTSTEEWAGQVLIELTDTEGGGQDPLNRSWIEWDSIGNTYSVVAGYEQWPATWVSWYGAMMYADFYNVSLPTEAEWEYAARAGQQLEYPTDDGGLSYAQANYGSFGPVMDTNYLPYPSVVGTFAPNPFGIYNMTGNVSEWCLDWYDANYYQICVDSNFLNDPINLQLPDTLEVRVLRGGNHTYPGPFAMSSHRFSTPPFVTTDHMGFRVVSHNIVGLNETEEFYDFKLYPNPVKNSFTIQHVGENNELMKIEVYNTLGEKVIDLETSNGEIISMENIPAGTYYCKIMTAKVSLVKPLVKD